MSALSRRSFLAGSAALAASPSLAAIPTSGYVDIAIVGAGAAGIAAARRVAAAQRSFVVLEAADHVGGRCATDTQTFGVPFDRGAHWLHMPDINPLAKLAPKAAFEVYPAPAGQRLRIGRRNAREGETEQFLASLVRANRAIGEAGRGKTDVSCAQALPKDLGEWRPTIDFVLGPFSCAKDLADVSATDFAKSAERDADAFCRQGYGALLAKLAEGLPILLGAAAKRIDWDRDIVLQTTRGRFSAQALIITASTNLLASEKIRFSPDLPQRQLDAAARLRLGSYDHIALELAGNPLGLQRDDLVFEKSDSARTAAILANVSGTSLCMIEVAGRFGRELAAQGEDAMLAFAADWLASLYGNDIRGALRRGTATRWNDEPWALGAFSAAAPGGQLARRVLMEPVKNRIWFAGEAAHETLWGTVGGAWESGERAAEGALRRLGPATPAPPAKKRRRQR